MTASGDEEDESNESMDTSHNTTAGSAASNAQIESDEAMARRLMQEMVEEENERDRSPIIRHIRPRRTASGTSGQVNSKTKIENRDFSGSFADFVPLERR